MLTPTDRGVGKNSARVVADQVMVKAQDQKSGSYVDLVGWRRRLLRSAGVDRRLARELAADLRTDLHALLNLIDRGCPPPLAARILAPLDQRPRR